MMISRRKNRKRQFLAALHPFVYKRRRKFKTNKNNPFSRNSSQIDFPDGNDGIDTKIGSFEKNLGQNELSSLHICQNQKWFILGASAKGNGHIAQKLPCQDAHKIELWDNGWGIATITAGAGSAVNADRASAFLAGESVKLARALISARNWITDDYFPADREWDKAARELFERIQNELLQYSTKNEIPVKHLHATLIMVIFSPHGLLIAHVGDGRAGYQDASSAWKALITPYEGEQVGETVFMTMDMIKHPHILETKVVREKVQAFTLLSDGCEKVCWNTLQLDKNTGKFIKPNTPFAPFFEKLRSVYTPPTNALTPDNLLDQYFIYIKEGHSGFRSETDDKTMIIGFKSP